MIRYNEDGTIYHCFDDGYFCELEEGVCTYCAYDSESAA